MKQVELRNVVHDEIVVVQEKTKEFKEAVQDLKENIKNVKDIVQTGGNIIQRETNAVLEGSNLVLSDLENIQGILNSEDMGDIATQLNDLSAGNELELDFNFDMDELENGLEESLESSDLFLESEEPSASLRTKLN